MGDYLFQTQLEQGGGKRDHLNIRVLAEIKRGLIGIICLCREITLPPGHEHFSFGESKGLFQTAFISYSLHPLGREKTGRMFSYSNKKITLT